MIHDDLLYLFVLPRFHFNLFDFHVLFNLRFLGFFQLSDIIGVSPVVQEGNEEEKKGMDSKGNYRISNDMRDLLPLTIPKLRRCR
ncbi:MAG: hypothetical protein C4527_07020 [Candidatus Omnitrophota bacterium]|nr:MAG: hypothetical protein C4527_07020 [Candidatus Omnitrophota bacterium]